MIARDWILDVLAKLELRYWPVFLWQLWWLDRYMKARRAEHGSGLIGYSVCARGRIYITLQAFGDKPDPNDWTRFAPRAPWEKLAPGRAMNMLASEGPSHRDEEPSVSTRFVWGDTALASHAALHPP